jgi:hypothetical protein
MAVMTSINHAPNRNGGSANESGMVWGAGDKMNLGVIGSVG